MDVPPAVLDQPGALDPGRLRGHIHFQDVSFSYAPEDPGAWRVKSISLEIKPGQKVAFVGGSGSGKSTLLNLVARFYDVTEGSLTIDGHDVRTLALGALRRNLGLVAQNFTLFRGTLAENLRFGRPEAAPAEVEAAARIGDVVEFLDQLEAGYDTPLGDFGQGLSGGQKQRVGIARAALCEPAILLLDEATSALDAESEAAVTRALDALSRDRTTLVIAHRLNTIRNADQIVVLGTDARGDGVVLAVGDHDTLLEACPEYADLWGRQRRKAILMPIGPLYNTSAALPTVLGLATAFKAPVYLLDFGPIPLAATLDKRFGVSVPVLQTDPRVVNARHLGRVQEIQRRVRAEGLEFASVAPPGPDADWVAATLEVIAQVEATHLVAVDNVLVPLEKLRESIRLIERKGGVEYILVNPSAGLE
jgi:ABC-type multidrug transport system ATPase subunit